MKRLLAGFAGVLGLSWLLKRRRVPEPVAGPAVEPVGEPLVEPVGEPLVEPVAEPAAEPVPDPRADELRAKIEEAKAAGDDREEFEAGETPVDAAEPGDPDERRRAVHDEARSRIEEMRGEGGTSGEATGGGE